METFSMLLAICAGNSPVTGEFPTQRPVTRSFDVFFDLRLKNLEASDLRRHCVHYDVIVMSDGVFIPAQYLLREHITAPNLEINLLSVARAITVKLSVMAFETV